MNHILKLMLIISICLLPSPSDAAPSKKDLEKELVEKKLRELEALKTQVDDARDSLQNMTAARYRNKQYYIEQREADKAEVDRLRESLERKYTELSQAKEEFLVQSQVLDDEKKTLAQKKDDWSFVDLALKDILQKQSDKISEVFPLILEQKRLDLEELKRSTKRQKASAISFNHYWDYKLKHIKSASKITFLKKSVLPDNGESVDLTLVRFGDVFGYGMGANGSLYSISQTGRLGASRYSIEKIEAKKLVEYLQISFPQWIEKQSINGLILLDIMQNAQSKILISGQKMGAWEEFYTELKAGGAVMIPLLLLPFWVLYLTFAKIIQFARKSLTHKKVYKTSISHIEKGDLSSVVDYCKKQKNALARIIKVCASNTSWSRPTAERAVQEVLIEEVPKLNTYLNTLSVIAGAAPLLGLLGTISGMINLFAAVTYHGTGDPKFLAGGISEALITAKTGLAVAIPTLFIHDYLRNRRDFIQSQIELFSMNLLNRLWPKE